MQVVFSDEQFPNEIVKSIFLEGPSPRSTEVVDWKRQAEDLLNSLGFDGTVFIPVPRHRFYSGAHDDKSWTYEDQIAWEVKGRQRADVIVAYVARNIDVTDKDLGMPGFTTNFEIGEDLSSGKLVYGRPADAPKNRYLDERVRMQGLPIHESLEATLAAAIEKLGEGAKRVGGEAAVPLFIWQSEQFQLWYANVKAAGNRLDDARLLHHVRFRSGPVFSYILWVNIWVEAEQRFKSNEWTFNRKDISSVVAYHHTGKDTEIVLVKEFRSPANNVEGMVFELPGGSSPQPGTDPRVNAQHELDEEVGLLIEDTTRFRVVGKRQLVAPLSAHRAQLYAIELTDEEMSKLRSAAAAGTVFGEAGTSEMTYVVIAKLSEINKIPVDYTTLGMIFEALNF